MKKLFIIVLILFWAGNALATTQYYYLRTTGAGGNASDTGTWEVLPDSDGDAMSASNFNESGNWSATDNASKLDSDDVVYVKGSWGGGYDLHPVSGITIDLYEPGDYDPETMSHSIEPVFHSTIYVEVDNVTIQDGRFDFAARHIVVAGNHESKVRYNKVLRSYFNCSREYGWASVYWGFVCDSELGYNQFEGIPHSECQPEINPTAPTGKGFVINAGSRNKIYNNHVKGGWVGFYFSGSRTWDDDRFTVDYPSRDHYTADPDANYEDNEVSYNYVERRCQEGISYDVSGSPTITTNVSIVERDTIASISGTTVTLNNSGGEWTGVGNLYSGYYMTAIPNRDDTYGNHALIESHSANTFTLKSEISNLGVGDTVVIGMAFRHNWIHNNTFGDEGFAATSIVLEGMALENLVENNVLPRLDWTEGMGISITSLDGYVNAYGNITDTFASEPTAYNIVRNNTCGGIWNQTYDKGYGPSEGFITRNNAIYDNDVYTDDYYPRYVALTNANAYVYNSGSLNLGTNGSLRETDPTQHVVDYFYPRQAIIIIH